MRNNPLYYIEHASPLGQLTLVASQAGICGIYFFDQRSFHGTAGWQPAADHALLRRTAQQLDEYFAGLRTGFDVALDLQMSGTPFQQQVWQELLCIDYGTTSTYGRHAERIARPRAVRAVGGAIGKNPVSIIVPCHRVLGSSGALTGYDGGLARKKYLLQLEGQSVAAGSVQPPPMALTR